MRQGYAQVQDDVLRVIYESEEPVDVTTVAKRIGTHWFTTYRAIVEIILDDLRHRHPEVLDDLRIRPIKTTRGWVFAKPVRPRSGPGGAERAGPTSHQARGPGGSVGRGPTREGDAGR